MGGHTGTIAFEQLSFHEREDGVRTLFMGRYFFDTPRDAFEEAVGAFIVREGKLSLSGRKEEYARKRLGPLIDDGFSRLRHINYGKPTVYIHKDSGVPLVGTNEFGIVDRGSNVIEVKPLTGCNFTCPYCSVDEGRNDKTHDYVVECDYLVEEAAKVAAGKTHPVEFHIGPQGEPFLYPDFVRLVRGLRAIPQCAVVTVVTNGSMLTERLIDELHDAGLTKINLSLNALSQETADRLSGVRYPLDHVLRMVRYCQGKISVMLAPTIVPGYNEQEIGPLVQLGKTLVSDYPTIGMQNFLLYKRGRNPVEQRSFEEFAALLRPHEEEHGVRLARLSKEDFRIHDEPELSKPFRKRDVVTARVAIPSRWPNEVIAVARDRCITVMGHGAHDLRPGRNVKVRIVRDKHSIYKGVLT